jgi:hypothetical protein
MQVGLKEEADGIVSSPIGFVKYDLDRIRALIVRYFIKCELPFRHVETEGFQEFVNGLEPRFKVQCRVATQIDCMKLHMDENDKLKDLLRGQRVCLTTWTSLQNLNYMCLTANLIIIIFYFKLICNCTCRGVDLTSWCVVADYCILWCYL